MRQAGPDHDQRAAVLGELVAGRTEGGHVVRRMSCISSTTGRCPRPRSVATSGVHEQLGEVDLQIARVGSAARGRHVDARLPAVHRRLLVTRIGVGLAKALEHAEEFLDAVRRPMPRASSRTAMCRAARDPAAGSTARGAPRSCRCPRAADGHRLEGVEQHGLAHTAQPSDDHAAFRAPRATRSSTTSNCWSSPVPAGQLGWALPRAGA